MNITIGYGTNLQKCLKIPCLSRLTHQIMRFIINYHNIK